MGTCSTVSQESIVHLIQKGDSAKAINMMVEFQDLFKSGSTVNSFGDTALHYAAALGNIDVVRWLVSHGSEMNSENSYGWTPTDSSHFCGNATVTDFLTSAGGNLKYFQQAKDRA